jgi:hypothetical protein
MVPGGSEFIMDMTNPDALAVALPVLADVARTDAERANINAARRGLAAITGRADASPGWGTGREPVVNALVDTLSDLMHLARLAGVDFDSIIVRAGSTFIEECEEELIAI